MGFEDYISDTVTTDIKYNGDQSEFMISCPFCDAERHDYKLYVSIDVDYSPWICFRCGRKGNPYSFVMAYEEISFQDAKDALELYGVEDNGINQAKETYGEGLEPEEYLYLMTLEEFRHNTKSHKVTDKGPPKEPVGYTPLTNNYSVEALPFRDYLYKRGVTEEQITKHSIGYIHKGYMETQNNNRAFINNHVVFLTKGLKGNYIYWNTRAIDNKSYVKSYNAPSTEEEYGKSDVIFNLNNAIHKNNVVLCEGVFDALTFGDSGIATFGKKASNVQIDLLRHYLKPEQNLYLFLDNDAINETTDLANKLSRPNTYIVINKTNKDANDLGSYKAMNMLVKSSVLADGQGELLAKLNLM